MSAQFKRAYVRPKVVDHGDVRQITQTAAAGPNLDGGGGANIYAS